MLRALSPIPVVGEPFLLRFLPAFSSQLAVTSAMGQLQVVDAGTPSASAQQLLQIDTEGAMCMAMDISSSCQCLAVGDGGGYLHTFLTNEAATFNCFSRQTEFADPVEPLPVSIPFDDTSIPYTAVSCPTFKNQPMLSDLPHKFAKRGYRKVPPISPAVLANMRLVGTIGYAPCPPNHIPNQVSYGYEKRLNHSGKHHSSDSASHKGIVIYKLKRQE